MTLTEVKTRYLNKQINAMNVGHLVKKYRDDLDVLYPYDLDVKAKMYIFLNDIDINEVICQQSGRARRFASHTAGFQTYCGNQSECPCNKKNAAAKIAAVTDDEWQQRTAIQKTTNLKKYGVEFASMLDTTKDKTAQTCIERYGATSPTKNANILAKSSSTCLKNNGVEWPQQNQNILEKTNNTFVSRYGVTRPAQNQIIQSKMKSTTLQRHGVENPMFSDKIKSKCSKSLGKTNYPKIVAARPTLTALFTEDEYVDTIQDKTLYLWQCNNCASEFYESIAKTTSISCPTCYPD